MKDISLKNKILDYVNSYNGWVTKGFIYILCEQEGYSPENGARRLRELENEGKILVSYYTGKRGILLARYAKLQTARPTSKPEIKIEIINGQAVAYI